MHIYRRGSRAVLPLMMLFRASVLGGLAAFVIVSQIGSALSQQPQQRKQPEVQKGFNAPLPADPATGINRKETRCIARPSCATGYRTFCVNPVGASPKCCHQWRVC